MSSWCIYILRCADGSLYTGIAKDVAKRVHEHNTNDRLAAKYTRARRPVQLVYQEAWATRSEAGKREAEIKRLPKRLKETLVLAQEAQERHALPCGASGGQQEISS